MPAQRAVRALVPGLAIVALGVFDAGPSGQAPAPTRDYPFQPVPFTAVTLTDEFWAPRIEVNRTATVPVAFEQCERTNRVDLFVRAAQVLRGEEPANRNPPGYPFDDTDVYKVIEGAAYTLSVHPDPTLDAYATWANRGPGEMIVWLPRTDAGAHPTPYPTLATTATITASVPIEGRGKSTRPIADGEAPRSSDDPSSYFDWWPARGSAAEWVEMALAKPATISEASVYWFDDTGHGSVRVPATWRLLYRDGAGWKPVEAVEGYGVARDRFNRVSFTPVTTGGLRIEVTMQPTFSAGLQEWTVK